MPGGSWSILVGHDDRLRVSWAGLRPRVELRRNDGRLFFYRPKVSGHLIVGPLTAHGRLYTFGRGA